MDTLIIPANPAAGFKWDISFRVVVIDNVKMVSVFDIMRHLVGPDCNQYILWSTVFDQLKEGVKNHKLLGLIIDARRVVMFLNMIPGKKAASFRMFSAGTMVQFLCGDDTLVAKIMNNTKIQEGQCDNTPIGELTEGKKAERGDTLVAEIESNAEIKEGRSDKTPVGESSEGKRVEGIQEGRCDNTQESLVGGLMKRKRAKGDDEECWVAIKKASMTANTINLNVHTAERAANLLERYEPSGLDRPTRLLLKEVAMNVLTSLVQVHS